MKSVLNKGMQLEIAEIQGCNGRLPVALMLEYGHHKEMWRMNKWILVVRLHSVENVRGIRKRR